MKKSAVMIYGTHEFTARLSNDKHSMQSIFCAKINKQNDRCHGKLWNISKNQGKLLKFTPWDTPYSTNC